jgi:hypothetical protein
LNKNHIYALEGADFRVLTGGYEEDDEVEETKKDDNTSKDGKEEKTVKAKKYKLKDKDVDILPCPLCRTDIRQKHLMLARNPTYYDPDSDDEYDENMAMRELIRAAEDNR